jgi:glycosyltransferase involved in cell wall biosynthesis
MAVYDIGFVLEQALGHVTHAKNLQINVPEDPQVKAHWALIDFQVDGLAGRVPIYNSNWTVRAGVRARQRLAQIARQTNLDALFFHTQVPAILARSWMEKIPSIVSLDATPLQYDEFGGVYRHEKGPAWLESLKWRLNRDCYKSARRIVAWAEWTKQGLVDDYEVSPEKIVVIPPGVNVSQWHRPMPREALDRPAKILFVGGDFERKGGLDLLEAFRALRDLDGELHIVTKDKIAVEPGLFVYNDMVPNSQPLKQLFHHCDIFALPTYGDTIALVLSEASAAGMAIVSTNIAGIPENVLHGETGLLVPPGDTAALTDALRTLATSSDLRLALGSSALAHASQKFDAAANARRLLDLLKAEADFAKFQRRQTASARGGDRSGPRDE